MKEGIAAIVGVVCLCLGLYVGANWINKPGDNTEAQVLTSLLARVEAQNQQRIAADREQIINAINALAKKVQELEQNVNADTTSESVP